MSRTTEWTANRRKKKRQKITKHFIATEAAIILCSRQTHFFLCCLVVEYKIESIDRPKKTNEMNWRRKIRKFRPFKLFYWNFLHFFCHSLRRNDCNFRMKQETHTYTIVYFDDSKFTMSRRSWILWCVFFFFLFFFCLSNRNQIEFSLFRHGEEILINEWLKAPKEWNNKWFHYRLAFNMARWLRVATVSVDI